MEIVFYNDQYIASEDLTISHNSRAFNYGDGFFESVKIINAKLFNFSNHFERIKISISVLRLNNNYSKAFFEEKIFHLLKVNKIINGSVKIHISRHGKGKYLPKSNNTELLISTSNGMIYKINKPISLCFYDNEFKSPGSLSSIKSSSSLIYILASIHANQNKFDNAILSNNSRNVVETANANIFMVNNDKIYTPRIEDGCVEGTMRSWACSELKIIKKSILVNELIAADEVFVTNSINGFTTVKNIESKSFVSYETANHLQKKLINLSLGL